MCAEKNKAGLLDFMADVQKKEGLHKQAEALLITMQEKNWSHPVFCAELLKIARQQGYTVTPEEVAKLRGQKEDYEPSEEVASGNGRCWPFDYSYYITHK